MMFNKNLTILTICQVFSFTAPPITVFISGIVGLKISPIVSLATLPTSLSIVGTAVFSFFAAKIMGKIGRKKGFMLSSIYSSLAALLGAFSIYSENFILFCISCFVIGTGIAFTHQYRFAAAETVEKNDSSRAISILLLATILSALIGPNVANFTKDIVQDHLYTGSYISLAILIIIPVFFLLFYKTDKDPKGIEEIKGKQRSYGELLQNPIILQAIITAAFAYSIMSFLMTATPISMYKMHGFNLGTTSIVIQSHIIGMFLPSLITGTLIKKYGHSVIIYIGALIYLFCISLSFYEQTFANYLISLVLLGVGWNFLFIGGTSLLVICYRDSEKFKVQGINDVFVFSIQSIASLTAGYSILKFSWNEINLACIPLTLLVILVSVRADIYKKKLSTSKS
jgi:MFS family permease